MKTDTGITGHVLANTNEHEKTLV